MQWQAYQKQTFKMYFHFIPYLPHVKTKPLLVNILSCGRLHLCAYDFSPSDCEGYVNKMMLITYPFIFKWSKLLSFCHSSIESLDWVILYGDKKYGTLGIWNHIW